MFMIITVNNLQIFYLYQLVCMRRKAHYDQMHNIFYQVKPMLKESRMVHKHELEKSRGKGKGVGIMKNKVGIASANNYYDIKIEKPWMKTDDFQREYLRLKTEGSKPIKSFKNSMILPDVKRIHQNLAPTINRKMSPILHTHQISPFKQQKEPPNANLEKSMIIHKNKFSNIQKSAQKRNKKEEAVFDNIFVTKDAVDFLDYKPVIVQYRRSNSQKRKRQEDENLYKGRNSSMRSRTRRSRTTMNNYERQKQNNRDKMKERNIRTSSPNKITISLTEQEQKLENKAKQQERVQNSSVKQLTKEVSVKSVQVIEKESTNIDWLNTKQLQFLADQRKEKSIQQQFYLLHLSPQLQYHTQPQLQLPPLPPLQTFQTLILPDPPSLNQSQNSYIQSMLGLCALLKLDIDYFQVKVKKFHNCILFVDEKEGKAVIRYYDGRFYYGGWISDSEEENKKVGMGRKEGFAIDYNNQEWYKGELLNNRRHGEGILMRNNGDIYQGEFRNGKKHGQGLLYDNLKKHYYCGVWKQDELNGQGFAIYSKKHFYQGHFINSKKSGKGQQQYPNGDIYIGYYSANQFQGQGHYYWASGAYYRGFFSKGARNGIGLWKAGREIEDPKLGGNLGARKLYYYGQFKENERCGYGVQYQKRGDLYLGYFNENYRNGVGIVRSRKGLISRCYWEKGKMIKIQQQEVIATKNESMKDF